MRTWHSNTHSLTKVTDSVMLNIGRPFSTIGLARSIPCGPSLIFGALRASILLCLSVTRRDVAWPSPREGHIQWYLWQQSLNRSLFKVNGMWESYGRSVKEKRVGVVCHAKNRYTHVPGHPLDSYRKASIRNGHCGLGKNNYLANHPKMTAVFESGTLLRSRAKTSYECRLETFLH